MNRTFKVERVYSNEFNIDELLLNIIETELENKLNELYNQTQEKADTATLEERKVA